MKERVCVEDRGESAFFFYSKILAKIRDTCVNGIEKNFLASVRSVFDY